MPIIVFKVTFRAFTIKVDHNIIFELLNLLIWYLILHGIEYCRVAQATQMHNILNYFSEPGMAFKVLS